MSVPAASSALTRSECIDSALISRAQEVMDRLAQADLSIVTAESCTGGLVCAALARAEGASKHLQGAFVTYTKRNKQQALGIPGAMLGNDGSVTLDVATELVEGALARSPADLAVAVTGVIGPCPDEDANPVGLVCFGCGRRGGPIATQEKHFANTGTDQLLRTVVLFSFQFVERVLTLP